MGADGGDDDLAVVLLPILQKVEDSMVHTQPSFAPQMEQVQQTGDFSHLLSSGNF